MFTKNKIEFKLLLLLLSFLIETFKNELFLGHSLNPQFVWQGTKNWGSLLK